MTKSKARYTESSGHGAASKFGQLIGEAFAEVVFEFIGQYLSTTHAEYLLLEPDQGKKVVRLEMFGGTSRQMDNVIVRTGTPEPVALFETKWLKDARHHNDKGAWILQLREIRKKYPTVRGAIANLAGYWTEGVGVMFETEGRIKMVRVATDEEVYQTLQEPIDRLLLQSSLPSFSWNIIEIRNRLPRAWDLANCLMDLNETGELKQIAWRWLSFERQKALDANLAPIIGRDLIAQAINQLLRPLPISPGIEKFEIALQIETGNIIYQEFYDIEEAMEFMRLYHQNPQAILDKITPKKR